MCLEIKKKSKLQIANRDIVVYKRLRAREIAQPLQDVKHGDKFDGVIKGIQCSGKISVEHGVTYLCTDYEFLRGGQADDKHGYKYSWKLDYYVTSVIINGKETVKEKSQVLKTPYRHSTITIGETYTSELKRSKTIVLGNRPLVEVYIGLHSFQKLEDAISDGIRGPHVECIIPKGSKYYIGIFHDKVSYASDQLKYVKIVN